MAVAAVAAAAFFAWALGIRQMTNISFVTLKMRINFLDSNLPKLLLHKKKKITLSLVGFESPKVIKFIQALENITCTTLSFIICPFSLKSTGNEVLTCGKSRQQPPHTVLSKP